MEQLEQLQTAVQDAKDEVTKEFQEKITERENEMEKEKQIMKDRLHEVLSNEANLLNRIKSLESDEGYGRAEVDKALAKVLSTIFLKTDSKLDSKFKSNLVRNLIGKPIRNSN